MSDPLRDLVRSIANDEWIGTHPGLIAAARLALIETPPEYERQLIDSALRYYGDTMPAYAASAGLSPSEYAAVMLDVQAARRLRARFAEETS